jgi:hypothetical protein
MANVTIVRTASSSQINSLLTQASASTTYLTQASASNTYLTQLSASTTYLTKSSGSTTYLTQSSASSTYAALSGAAFTGNISTTGRITATSQPAFNATYTDGSVTFSAGVVVFNSARTNVGSHYSTSTGRFTAPVAGHYHFDVHFFKYTSYTNPSNTYWGFRVNGGATVTTNHGAQGSDGGQSLSTTIYLNANDYIDVYAQNTIQSWGGQFLQFSGYLVG